jgi:hypothetical protein
MFDDRFYITTNVPDFARVFFGTEEKRRASEEIHDRGFNQIIHDGKVLTAKCSPVRPDRQFDTTLMTEIVSRLALLAREVPTEPLSSSSLNEPNWRLRRIAAFAAPGLTYFVGVNALIFGFLMFRPLDMWQAALESLKYSIPLLGISVWLAVSLLRGRSSSHRELMIVLALCLFGFPLAGAGVLMFLNGGLDVSEAKTHTVQVIDKYISESDDTTRHYAVLESWRKNKNFETLSISSYDYEKAIPNNSTITVRTKPGRFGYEWIVDHRLDEIKVSGR